MEKKKIIWIDDDINSSILCSYVDEFEDRGYEILRFENADDFFFLVKDATLESVVAILVDIIMPSGSFDFGMAKGGLQTGVLVIDKMLKSMPLSSIPIIVVTNSTNEDVIDYCEMNKIPFLEKVGFFTDTLVDRIANIIKNF